MTASPELERLAASPYLLLTTFRKDGTAVPTPVWVSSDGARLYVWTEATSGKVKRIRNRGHVLLAPSDGRGVPQGASVDGSAQVLDAPEDLATVAALHKRKYGWQFRAFTLGSRIMRRRTVGLAITVV